MSESGNLLGYEPARQTRIRWFHCWALPLLWLPGSVLSIIYYGDEYAMLAAAHFPALPLISAVAPSAGMTTVIVLCVSICVSLVCGGGILMDVMHVPRWLYLPAGGWFLLFNALLLAYGGWSIFGVGPAWCASIYCLIAFSNTGYGIALIVKRVWEKMRKGE